MAVEVHEVAPGDDEALRRFHDVERAVVAHDRPDAAPRTWQEVRTDLEATTRRRPVPLLAVEDGVVVGIADLALELEDNTHLADLEVSVLPGARGRGVGRTLARAGCDRAAAAGRRLGCGEVHVPADSPIGSSPGLALARSMGWRVVHSEEHLVLDLPVAPDRLAGLAARAGTGTAYDVVTWTDVCPEDLLEEYAALRTQMERDVPVGDLELEPVVHTPQRVREGEQRTRAAHVRLVAAARERSSGRLVGYSCVFLPHGSDEAQQDDTLVLPGHRGSRLGLRLKLATLGVVGAEHPERRRLHTWTAPDNGPMLATNLAMGYRVVERLHEVQGPVAPAP